MKKKRVQLSRKKIDALRQYPQYYDEETMEGSMPDPESDDDTLEDIQQWGLYLDHDEEHQKELDMEGELTKSERARRKKKIKEEF